VNLNGTVDVIGTVDERSQPGARPSGPLREYEYDPDPEPSLALK
jgi:hypothetical protein